MCLGATATGAGLSGDIRPPPRGLVPRHKTRTGRGNDLGTTTRVNRRNEPVTGRDMEEGKADTYHYATVTKRFCLVARH